MTFAGIDVCGGVSGQGGHPNMGIVFPPIPLQLFLHKSEQPAIETNTRINTMTISVFMNVSPH